jgi:hypothetical protein
LLPLIGLSLCAKSGNLYAGLYYPILVATTTLLFGSVFLRETHETKIRAEVDRKQASDEENSLSDVWEKLAFFFAESRM